MKYYHDVLLCTPFLGQTLTSKFLAPSLGIYSIASFLRNQGIEATVFDPNLDVGNKFINTIKLSKYTFIGFSTTHETLSHDLELLASARRINPDAVFLIGGAEATTYYNEIFKNIPYNLIAVIGPGEHTLFDMIKVYNPKKTWIDNFSSIKGLRIKENRNIYSTGDPNTFDINKFIEVTHSMDFQSVPYELYWSSNRELFSKNSLQIMGAYINTLRLSTSMRCNHRCIFCSSRTYSDIFSKGLTVRQQQLSPLHVLKLIEKSLQAFPDAEALYFNDDNFFYNKKRTIELCRLIIEARDTSNSSSPLKNRRLKFICQARVNGITPEFLIILKNAGFVAISYGVESFSEKILEFYNKGNRIEEIERVLKNTLQIGINVLINIILFPPNITLDDLCGTIDRAVYYIHELGAHIVHNNFIISMPGAEINEMTFPEECIEYRRIQIPEDNIDFDIKLKILPVDPYMKKLSLDAVSKSNEISNFIVRTFDLDTRHITQTLGALIIFYAIYELLNDSRKENVFKAIKKVIER